jgi:hypothetical protein
MKKIKEIKEKPLTMKEKILRFVESKGTATFTEIQRFIVDSTEGEGTYDKGRHLESVWVYGPRIGGCHRESKSVMKYINSYRGTYSNAFTEGSGYLRLGKQYLEKEGRKYYTVRDGEWKKTPARRKRSFYHRDYFPGTGGSGLNSYREEEVNPRTLYEAPRFELESAVGNFDDCKIEVLRDNCENGCVSEPIISEPFGAHYDREADLTIIVTGEGEYLDSFSGAPVERMQKKVDFDVFSKSIETPLYCRWCGHKLHISHFQEDSNQVKPTHCQWCGHTL